MALLPISLSSVPTAVLAANINPSVLLAAPLRIMLANVAFPDVSLETPALFIVTVPKANDVVVPVHWIVSCVDTYVLA